MSISSVSGSLAQAVKHFARTPPKNSWPIAMRQPSMARVKIGIAGSPGKPYWVPEKNIPGLKRSVKQISAHSGVSLSICRGFATQGKSPKSTEDRKGFSPFAKNAIAFLKERRSEISFIELQPPETPLTEREIGGILETLAQIRSQWHSLVLVPPTELLDDGPCMKDPQAAHFEEAMERIKTSLAYPSIAFLNVGLRSGALIRLLHYSLQEGYSIQFQLNQPPERDCQ